LEGVGPTQQPSRFHFAWSIYGTFLCM